MTSALVIIKLFMSIGPAVIKFMLELEKVFPEGGQGALKLAALRAYVEGLWSTLGNTVPKFEEIWPTLEKIVSFVKSALKGGLFKKV